MYEESELPDDDYGFVTDYLEEQEIAVKDDCIFYMYLPEREAFRQRVKYEFPAVAISLSDYNHLLTMRGYEPVALDEDEFGLQWQSIATEESRKEFLLKKRLNWNRYLEKFIPRLIRAYTTPSVPGHSRSTALRR